MTESANRRIWAAARRSAPSSFPSPPSARSSPSARSGRSATIVPTPEQGGLPGGLAVLFLYGFGVVGLAVCALGFAIPPGDGFGVEFERRQRYLFGLSAAGALGSVVLPLLTLPVALGAGPEQDLLWLVAVAWVGPLATSVLSLLGGLTWRGASAAYVSLEGEGDDADSAT